MDLKFGAGPVIFWASFTLFDIAVFTIAPARIEARQRSRSGAPSQILWVNNNPAALPRMDPPQLLWTRSEEQEPDKDVPQLLWTREEADTKQDIAPSNEHPTSPQVACKDSVRIINVEMNPIVKQDEPPDHTVSI